jgi:hypothetical protein
MPPTRTSRTTSNSKKKTTRRKTTTAQTTARKKTGARRTKSKTADVSDDLRRQMIQEAAYLKAEARGFQGGDTEADWLAAEAEVDAQISTGA